MSTNSLRKRQFSSSSSSLSLSPKRKTSKQNLTRNSPPNDRESFSISPLIRNSSSPFDDIRETSDKPFTPPHNGRGKGGGDKTYGKGGQFYSKSNKNRDRAKISKREKRQNLSPHKWKENRNNRWKNHFEEDFTRDDLEREDDLLPSREDFRRDNFKKDGAKIEDERQFLDQTKRRKWNEIEFRNAKKDEWQERNYEDEKRKRFSSRGSYEEKEMAVDRWKGEGKNKEQIDDDRYRYFERNRGRSYERAEEVKVDIEKEGRLMSYKEFLARQRDDITPEEAQKLFVQYKKEHKLSNAKIFFERHKYEEWFREKYCPSIRLELLKKHIKLSEKASKNFFEELEFIKKSEDFLSEGKEFIKKYDLDRDEDAFNFIKNVESDLSTENESERMKEIEKRLYDERQKGGEFSESESELDEASGEASKDKPKSDFEGKKPEEKSAFSLSFGREPAKSGPSQHCDENSVFVSTIPLKLTRKHLEDVFINVPGFQKICVSDPIPKYNMNRFAWITFDSQENCLKALALNGTKITYSKEFAPLYLHILPKKKSSKCVQPAHFYTLIEKRIDFDIQQALKVVEALNERKIFEEKFDENLLKKIPSKIARLNLLLTYLRKVHSFCYYCGVNYMTEEGLMSRCTKNHPRNSIISLEKESNFHFSSGFNTSPDSEPSFKQWARDLDDRINNFLDHDESKNTIGWADAKEALFLEIHKELRMGKPRCKLCKKLFVAENFLKKHLWNKHSEMFKEFKEKEDENDFFENYEKDSNRFMLENVEPVIPGDVSFDGQKKGSFYRKQFIENDNPNKINEKDFSYRTGYKTQNANRYPYKRYRNFVKRVYVDLDKPLGDGEESVDYGFATETTPLFHL